MKLPLRILASFFCFIPLSSATEGDARVAEAVRTDLPIKIDGKLDEEAWQQATSYGGFTQRFPFVGEPATERTEFRLLYDDRQLYVGVYGFDSEPGKIVARSKRFDSSRIFRDDFIAVKIDPTHDRRTTYYFGVNPQGAKLDAKVLNNGAQFLTGWNSVWYVGVSRDGSGWYAEFAIPFTSIEYEPQVAEVLGFNITRGVIRKREEFDWAAIPPPFSGLQASKYGHLKRIPVPVQNWRKLSLIPYISTGFDQDTVEATDGDELGNADLIFEPGVDLKYPLSRSALLQATVNTDFSQVDIDEAQINFNRFTLFFPERRGFFLEGAQFFDFGVRTRSQLFFSRQIGLDADAEVIVPIIAGVRSYGSVGRSEYGVLNIQTEEVGEVPARNFSVGRFRQRILSNSEAGFIATHRQDVEGGDGNNSVFGVDSLLRTRDNRLRTIQYAAFSHSKADLNNPNDDVDGFGGSGFFLAQWRPGLWDIAQSSLFISDDFKPEIGFVQRTGILREALDIRKDFRMAKRNIDTLEVFTTSIAVFTDELDDLLDYSADLGFALRTNVGYRYVLRGLIASDDVLDEFELNNRVIIPADRYTEKSIIATFETPPQYYVKGKITYRYGGFFGGTLNRVVPQLTLRPITALFIDANINISFIDLDNLNDNFTSTVFNGSASYSLNTSMYIDINVAWNSVDEFVDLQYRYRWRFRPLSDFFIVYNEERDDSGFGTNLRSLIFKLAFHFST